MFEIQICCEGRWISMQPTRGRPYQFDTEEDATRVKNICYPESSAENVRIIPVGDLN